VIRLPFKSDLSENCAIVCLVVVGLPKPWREHLGYDELIKPYRGWISLVGLGSGVYWFVIVTADFPHWVLGKWQEWQLRKIAQDYLRRLSPDEKGYIAKYIKGNVSSCEFNLGDGIINGLEAKSVVYRPANISCHGSYFAFNLQPWVLKALGVCPSN